MAMISDKVSSSELGRLQKELTSKEKLLWETQEDMGVKLTARRVQQALQEWEKKEGGESSGARL